MTEINKLKEKYNQEVAYFFGLKTIPIEVKVCTREDIDKAKGYKTENWVVGTAIGNTVYILEKKRWEKETPHPASEFEKVLKHEIAHIYYREYKGNHAPAWLNEGVAQLVANQRLGVPKENITIQILDKNHSHAPKAHLIGCFMVYKIVEEFGKEKLFELIRLQDRQARYQELQRMFEWLK